MASFLPLLLHCLFVTCQGLAGQADDHQIQLRVTNMANKMVEMEEKVKQLEMAMGEKDKEMEDMKTKMKGLELKSPRDLPFLLTCSYRQHWVTPSTTITFDRLTAEHDNSDRPGGGDGSMDISTGRFTALTAGHSKLQKVENTLRELYMTQQCFKVSAKLFPQICH